VTPGWKKCPSCTAELSPAPGPAGPAPEEPRPAGSEPAPASAEGDAAAAESEIKQVEAELERLDKAGQNVAHARNLLKLAISFLRGGSYEKATRYARKVKNVLEEKKGA
jgi:hypothetical protein